MMKMSSFKVLFLSFLVVLCEADRISPMSRKIQHFDLDKYNFRRRTTHFNDTNKKGKSVILMSSTSNENIPSSNADESTTPPQSNPVMQLANYVKDSIVRLKDGTVELYSNYKECNSIRSQQKQYTQQNPKSPGMTYQKTGMSYYEYNFLNKGKEDRGKVFNLVFMMFFSPNFLPYAFMFFPNALPSPFQQKPPLDLNKWEMISRERSHAVMATLLDIEKEAKSVPTGNPLNPFGGGKARKNKERMGIVYQMAGKMLLFGAKSNRNQMVNEITNSPHQGVVDASAVSSSNEENILQVLQNEIFSDKELERSQTRLTFVPKAIMKGLALAIDGNTVTAKGTSGANRGALSSLVPFFLTRNKVISHLKTLNDADSFLVNEEIDLDSLSGDVLLEACHARMIGTPESSESELRNGLSKWLDLTVIRPNTLMLPDSSKAVTLEDSNSVEQNVNVGGISNDVSVRAPTMVTTTSPVDDMSSSNPKYFNANLAKFALMCYNAVDGARDTRSASALPRFLFH